MDNIFATKLSQNFGERERVGIWKHRTEFEINSRNFDALWILFCSLASWVYFCVQSLVAISWKSTLRPMAINIAVPQLVVRP